MSSDRKLAVSVLAVIAIVFGVIVVINAAGAPFASSKGEQLWRLFAMNAAGGLITIVGGLVALGSVLTRMRAPALLAGLGFLAVATFTLIALTRSFNLVGGRASTVALLLALGLGFTALAVSPEAPAPSPRAPAAPARRGDEDVA